MVSVIILSYNTRETTLKCLECLYRSSYKDFETIVVDNCSKDGSVEAINKKFPQVKIIANHENVGFAKGNNQGMQEAKGEYFLLLNSDAFVFQDTIELLVNEFEANKDIDMAGCQLFYEDGLIQPSWGYFPTLRRIWQSMLFIDNLPIIKNSIDAIHVRNEERYEKNRQVDWVTGAVVFLKRKAWTDTSGFDEKLFMYGEEIEWMYRCKKAKNKIWYLYKPTTVHLVGKSSPDRAPAVLGEIKGWFYWFEKHNKPWQKNWLKLAVMVGCGLRMILKPRQKKFYSEALAEIMTPAKEAAKTDRTKDNT